MPPLDWRLREAPLEGLFAGDPRLDTLKLRPADLPLSFAPDVWLDGKALMRARRPVHAEMGHGGVTLQLSRDRSNGEDGLELRVMSLALIAEVARYEGPEGGPEDMETIAFPEQARIFAALKRRIGKVAVHRLMCVGGRRPILCMKVSPGFADWSRALDGAFPPRGLGRDAGHAPEG
ncbi:hypothetical protein ACQ5SO_01630 [Rhodovulum sp. DZ06]|uniref:hypothetical protein n=1 Tax=Rhodovulum sp. DZ06 TaxID=3425126 RepID=UPI003D350C45